MEPIIRRDFIEARDRSLNGLSEVALSSGDEVRPGTDHTGSLNRARSRRILGQGSMRSDAIVAEFHGSIAMAVNDQ
jgi:hypothetical protein